MDRTTNRPPVGSDLTPRQREVLSLMARGLTNAMIAERLGISLAGAKWHVSEVLSKLGVESREEAADYWRRERRLPRRFAQAFLHPTRLAWLGLGGAVLGATAVAVVGAVALLGRGSDQTEADRVLQNARSAVASFDARGSVVMTSVVPILHWDSGDLQTARAVVDPDVNEARTALWYQGPDQKRAETELTHGQDTVGSLVSVWDGGSVWVYSMQLGTVRIYKQMQGGVVNLGSLSMTASGGGSLNSVLDQAGDCYTAPRVDGQEVVVSRLAYVVNLGRSACPATVNADPRGYGGIADRTIWVDTQTGFVLRDELRDTEGNTVSGTTSRVVAIDYNVTIDAHRFEFQVPPGVTVEDCRSSSCP